jgi:hypothetical protein
MAPPVKVKRAKPVKIHPPSATEVAAAKKDVTEWVEDNMRDWAIYSIKALQEAPWPPKPEIPEWIGILAEGVEWAVVALAPEIEAIVEAAKTAIDVTGKVITFATSTGIVAPMEQPDIKQIFSDGIDRFRGKVEKKIKDNFVHDWATDVALLRKDKPAKTDAEQKAYTWLQMFPQIDYDDDRYYNLKVGIVGAIAAAIPVYKQQLSDYGALQSDCDAKAVKFVGGGQNFSFEAVVNQPEVDACYASLPPFQPHVSFKMPAKDGKVKRAPMASLWMSMCTKY